MSYCQKIGMNTSCNPWLSRSWPAKEGQVFMWFVVLLVGIGLALNGYFAGAHLDTVVQQIYASAYLVGGVIVMALSQVILALTVLRGEVSLMAAALRGSVSSRSLDSDGAAPAPAGQQSSGLGKIDGEVLSSMRARWAREEAPPSEKQNWFVVWRGWLIAGAIVCAIAALWFYR